MDAKNPQPKLAKVAINNSSIIFCVALLFTFSKNVGLIIVFNDVINIFPFIAHVLGD